MVIGHSRLLWPVLGNTNAPDPVYTRFASNSPTKTTPRYSILSGNMKMEKIDQMHISPGRPYYCKHSQSFSPHNCDAFWLSAGPWSLHGHWPHSSLPLSLFSHQGCYLTDSEAPAERPLSSCIIHHIGLGLLSINAVSPCVSLNFLLKMHFQDRASNATHTSVHIALRDIGCWIWFLVVSCYESYTICCTLSLTYICEVRSNCW